MESIITALFDMSGKDQILMISFLLHVVTLRLWYKYTQMDKVILLMADRSHRDIIHIEADGNYSIKQPLNKPRPTLQEKVNANTKPAR